MGKMENGPLLWGPFFKCWDICIYWSGCKGLREMFVYLQEVFQHPRIYGYLRVWAYLHNIYGIPANAYMRKYGHR
jgi:hypothetical protein